MEVNANQMHNTNANNKSIHNRLWLCIDLFQCEIIEIIIEVIEQLLLFTFYLKQEEDEGEFIDYATAEGKPPDGWVGPSEGAIWSHSHTNKY